MTDKQILEQAIQKALTNGWVALNNGYEPANNHTVVHIITQDSRLYIYSHDFAKALWGESGVPTLPLGGRLLHPWEAHLQQMVIADDPIAYLGANL